MLPLRWQPAHPLEEKELSEYRPSRNETAHFTSFEQMRSAMNLPKIQKRTKNVEKLNKQREQFLGKCKACGSPLNYVKGMNVLVCSNKDCKGIKLKSKTEGEEDRYIPVIKVLDDKSADIAKNLFEE